MAMIETWFSQDLTEPVQVHQLDGNVFSQDNQGNLIGVNVFDGGAPATLSGTVSGNVIRADGTTVAVTGVLTNNSCYIIMPSAAYAVPGIISVVIKLTGGGSTTTLCAVVANVYQSATDATVDPGTIIPSIQDLIDAIDEAVASIPPDYSELSQAAIKGNYVWNASKLSTYPTANALPVQSCYIGNFSGSDYDTLNLPSRTDFFLDPSVFQIETVGNATFKVQTATFSYNNLTRKFVRMCVSGTWKAWALLSDNGYFWNANSKAAFPTADALPLQTCFIGNFSSADYDTAHLPPRVTYAIDASVFLIETYGNATLVVQTATFGNNGTAKLFIRTRVSGTWGAWKPIFGGDAYIIDKGGSGNNTSLVAGIIEAYEAGIKNISILPGTYNMVSEFQAYFGANWETSLLNSNYSSGLPIGKGMILNFAPGAVVVFDYSSGRNTDINRLTSAFMAKAGDYEINGLNISCKNIRYCVHDELAGVGVYRHTYVNCKMSMIDDANTPWKSCQCIGGGLGKSGNIEIRNCIFYSDNNGDNAGVGAVSYHNGEYADIKSFISIMGCYFAGNNGTFRISWYGSSTLITVLLASNNSLQIAPIIRAETAGSTIENVEFFGFNNVIRQQ